MEKKIQRKKLRTKETFIFTQNNIHKNQLTNVIKNERHINC